MLVLNRTRLRRPPLFGGLGQASAESDNPFERFLGAVENAYNRAEEAINLARSGKLEEARVKAGGTDPKAYVPDSAQAWSMAAWDELAALKEANYISPKEHIEIIRSIMNPLESAVVGMQRVINTNEYTILRWWNNFVGYGAEIISGTTGFFGEKWEKIVNFYKTTAGLNSLIRRTIEEIKTTNPSPDTLKRVQDLELAVKKGEFILKKVELSFTEHGIPTDQLRKGTGLGAAIAVLAAKVAAAVGAALTIANIIAVIWKIILFIATWILIDYLISIVQSLAGIESEAEALRRELSEKDERVRELENRIAIAKRAELETRKIIGQYREDEVITDPQIAAIQEATEPKESIIPFLFIAGGILFLAGIALSRKKS